MKVEVIEIRFLEGWKTTRAFCDVQIGDVTIRDFRVCQADRKPFVRNPFNTYKNIDGSLTFREIVSLPPTVQSEVHALILSEYFRRLKEKNHETQDQPR